MNDDEGIPDEDMDYPDSGPYCEHWDYPFDCTEVCATCGMRCKDHSPEDNHDFNNGD